MAYKILVINTGASSTKIGFFLEEEIILELNIKHPYEEINNLKLQEHKLYRTAKILEVLERNEIKLNEISAVSAIGGLLRPLKSGTYKVNSEMLKDLEEGSRGFHASNLGGLIANEIVSKIEVPAFIVDPVSVDELGKLARYSGSKLFERESLSHALNTKAVAKRWSKERNKDYTSVNLIVVHLGSGITVSAHKNGEMTDITNSMEEGAFSVERCGTVPSMKLAKTCFEGKYTFAEVRKMLFGEGGIYSYLGIKDFKMVMDKVKNNDEYAKEIVDAMIYQIAKDIGAMATVLEGKIDSIILTGGMSYDPYLVENLSSRVSFLAEICIYEGEDELKALAEGALRVLRGEERYQIY